MPGRWPDVRRLDGVMDRFAGCACLLVRGVVCCGSDAIPVHNRFKRVRLVHFACLIGSAASSVQFGARGQSASVQFVQFSSRTLPAQADAARRNHVLRSACGSWIIIPEYIPLELNISES